MNVIVLLQMFGSMIKPLIFIDKHTLSWFFGIKWRQVVISALAVIFLLLFIPFYTYASYRDDLLSAQRLMNKNDKGVVLLDDQGKPFFTFYDGKYKQQIALSEIPLVTRQAVISVEDRDFYYHPGFSVRAIVRSVVSDLKNRRLDYGGSTITQQLVKNALLNSKKDFLRKYQEISLATEVEKRYTKDEILQMYLNSVYFGEGAFGIEQASQVYFGEDAKDLDLAQSTMLAGILESPSRLSPLSGDLSEAKLRQKHTLDTMVEAGYIDQKQSQVAYDEKLHFQNREEDIGFSAPHFALLARDELIKKYGEETVANSGFRVKTTINLNWQKEAEKVVADQVEKLRGQQVSNGAVVVADPKNGEIKALVGSKDWYDAKFGKLDVALFPRSPGSSFKPIVYLAAFEDNLITPATILHDQPTAFKNDDKTNDPTLAYYRPLNYDRKFRGNVTVRRALANSLNVPSVEVLSKLGVPKALEMAKKLGITSLKDSSNYGLSLVLGTGEVPLLQMVQAYSVLANDGYKNNLTTITEIDDREGNVIYKHTPEQEAVVDPKDVFLISSILSDEKTRAEEFGNLLNISRSAAVKTGTAEDYRDSWTLGYTPSLVIGAWVGNNNGEKMDQIAGSLGAAPIWKDLMEQFLKNTPVEKFDPPGGVVSESICPWNGLPLKEATSSGQIEYFIQGTQPQGFCNPNPNPVNKTHLQIRLSDGQVLELDLPDNTATALVNIH